MNDIIGASENKIERIPKEKKKQNKPEAITSRMSEIGYDVFAAYKACHRYERI